MTDRRKFQEPPSFLFAFVFVYLCLFICVFVYLCICVFVYLCICVFLPFCIAAPPLATQELTQERLTSNSSVAFDHQILIVIIKYHQKSIESEKNKIPETCSKKSLIFSSAKHNYVSMCITVKKNLKKVDKQKNKLASNIVKTTRGSPAPKIFIFNNLFKILLIMLDLKTQLVTSSPCSGANFELSWPNVKIFVEKLQPFYGHIIFFLKISKNRFFVRW